MSNAATSIARVLPLLVAVAGCGNPPERANMDRAFALQRDYSRLIDCASVMRRLTREYEYLEREPPEPSLPTSAAERREAREQKVVRSAAGYRFERAADAKLHDAVVAGARRIGEGSAAVYMDVYLDVEAAQRRLLEAFPNTAGPRETIAALANRAAICERQLNQLPRI